MIGGVVVDTSAIVAILLEEPGWHELATVMNAADERLLSTATLVEAGIVMEDRARPMGAGFVNLLVREAEIEIIDLDRADAESAIDAWRRFGRGKHPARLNLGDCFTYALAERTGYPILCVGDDFAQTDLEVLPAR